jgi:hypothetical protein
LNRAAAAAALLAAFSTGVPAPAAAQSRRPASKAPLLRTAPADMTCPAPLGTGVRTGRLFCDVLAGRDASGGILIKIPKHQGQATLTFDLHNRHTYSADQVAAGRAYARYTATIGVLTLDNTLLSRFVVRNEFRREADLFDRVSGGSGPGGVKAVAPTGVEPVTIQLPPGTEQVSILGEKVATVRIDGEVLFSTPGRPIAVISQPMVEFRPPATPPKRTTRTKKR